MKKNSILYRGTAVVLGAVLAFTSFHLDVIRAYAEETKGRQEAGAQETIKISSVKELMEFSEKSTNDAYSLGKTFVLTADLDLGDQDFKPVSIFCGTFDGGGHNITGFRLKEAGSDLGLFRFVEESGVIKNLNVSGELMPKGTKTNIGGIAGTNRGMIENCSFDGRIVAKEAAGGIAGHNEEAGKILGCTNTADIICTKRTGGIAGYNEGLISGAKNEGDINATAETVNEMDDEEESSFNFSFTFDESMLVDEEKINFTGGIAGASSGTVQNSSNHGTVGYQHIGYKTAGIVGYQTGFVNNCGNFGTIWGRKDIGGIAGQFEPYVEVTYQSDTTDEVRAQVDDLIDMLDELSDIAGDAGDDTLDNIDAVSDTIKGIRDSLDGYKDYYSDQWDAFDDDLEDVLDNISKYIDRLEIDIDGDAAKEAVAAIKKDFNGIAQILKALSGLSDGSGSSLEELNRKIEELKRLLAGIQTASYTAGNETVENVPPATVPDGELNGTDTEESADTEGSTDAGESTGGSESEDEEESTGGSESADTEESTGGSESADEEEGISGSGDEGAAGSESARAVPVSGREFMLFAAPENGADAAAATISGNSPVINPQVIASRKEALAKLTELLNDMSAQMNKLEQFAGTSVAEVKSFSVNFENLKKATRDLKGLIRSNSRRLGDDLDATDEDLSAQTDNLSDQLTKLKDDMRDGGDDVRAQMDKISDQFKLVHNTVSDGFDRLKDKFDREDDDEELYDDMSDTEDESDMAGKILNSRNEGEIFADMNGGGVVGTMGVETDAESDFGINREGSISFEIDRTVRATVLNCSNYSDVIVKNDYAGGIVGKADVGAMISCKNYGNIRTTDGDYAGGIAGKSRYLIRNSYSLCNIEGNNYAGGIAGLGKDLTGNCAMAGIYSENGEKTGTVAGDADGIIAGNSFVDEGTAAVNGLTYQEQARPLQYHELLQMEGVPEEFGSFQVKFVADNQVLKKITCSYGESIKQSDFPAIPEKKGNYAVWENVDLTDIRRNITVHAVYGSWTTTIATEEKLPVILVSADFFPGAAIEYKELEAGQLTAPAGYKALAGYEYAITPSDGREYGMLKVRVYAEGFPRYASAAVMKNGSFMPVDTKRDGKYLVFYMDAPGQFAVISSGQEAEIGIGALLVLLLLAAVAVIVLVRKKKRPAADKINAQPEKAEKPEAQETEPENVEEPEAKGGKEENED